MIQRPTRAERLDRALDDLLAGATPAVAAAGAGVTDADRPLLATAARLREQLGTSLVAPRFEARLGARLSISPSPWILRHPGRLIVTGAVGSAVGVGVTAFAVWRGARLRAPHRLLHR